MQANQRSDAKNFGVEIQRYLQDNRLMVSIQSITDKQMIISGCVPTYYARQKIQQAIMRMLPKGIQLEDEGVRVGYFDNALMT